MEIVAGHAGLRLSALLPMDVDDRLVSVRAAEHGIEAPALSDYFLASDARPGLFLRYGAATPEHIPTAWS